MNKQHKSVLVPMDKRDWQRGDILKSKNGILIIAPLSYKETEKVDNWQVQQLLILNDEPIKEGDYTYSEFGNSFNQCNNIEGCNIINKSTDFKKIIASYPHISGTLPISIEDVKIFVERGCPDNISVEMTVLFPKAFDKPNQPKLQDGNICLI